MKFKQTIAFLALALCSFGAKAQIVHIPDETFLEYMLLYTNVDTNLDGQIQVSEAEAYTGIVNVYNSATKDLTGLEAFKNITILQISKTGISHLDISNNTKLVGLFASSTMIDKIDISKNTSLTQVEAQYNSRLSTFIFGTQVFNDLQSVSLGFNILETIDVSNCPNLSVLAITSNQFKSIDLTKNPRLTRLSAGANQLTALDVTKNTRLMTLGIGVNQITQIDLSKNKQLDILNINSNPLMSLNLNNNTFLTQVFVDYTNIAELDISKLEMLRQYYVTATKIKKIDASKNAALVGLHASYCPDLESVDMKNGNNINVLLCVTKDDPKLRCIQVDDVAYSSSAFLWEKDETATYTEDCTLLAVNDSQLNDNLMVYPNPTADVLNINTKAYAVTVTNFAGQVVKTEKNVESVDMSRLPVGAYIVNIQREQNGAYTTKKVIKK